MKTYLKTLILLLLLSTKIVTAQNERREEKSPIELASEQADRFQRELKLNDYQLFKADSILQHNISGVMDQFEEMRKGGMQNPESYRDVQKLWQDKTDKAFEALLTLEQYDRFLRITGRSKKERKAIMARLKRSLD